MVTTLFTTVNLLYRTMLCIDYSKHNRNYTCKGQSNDSQSSEISDTVTLTVGESVAVTTRFWSFAPPVHSTFLLNVSKVHHLKHISKYREI